jgi:hypothetical protein
MQLGAWRLRRCISRRAPKFESFFESRESSNHWGHPYRAAVSLKLDQTRDTLED